MSAIEVGHPGFNAWNKKPIVPLKPFLEWVAERRTRYARAYGIGVPPERRNGRGTKYADGLALEEVLKDLGWNDQSGTRRFYRYTHDEQLTGHAPVAVIEDALEHAGLRIWDVYPDVDYGDPIDRWCHKCREVVMTDDTLICPWCESETREVAS